MHVDGRQTSHPLFRFPLLLYHQLGLTYHQLGFTYHQLGFTYHQLGLTYHQLGLTYHQLGLMRVSNSVSHNFCYGFQHMF